MDDLRQNIDLYTTQLKQVELALQASGPNEELLKLKKDLKEVIKLTEESLLALMKSQLLLEIETGNLQLSESAPSLPPAPPPPPPPAPPPRPPPPPVAKAETSKKNDLDAEYEAFKALFSDTSETPKTATAENSKILGCQDNEVVVAGCSFDHSGNSPNTSCSDSEGGDEKQKREEEEEDREDEEEEEENRMLTERMRTLIGSKCRAPYRTEWSMYGYHNALITDVLPFESTSPAKVQVMFCNPTHHAMVPCQYFLNGSCKFSDEKCNFSHGYVINLDDIKSYLDPDYSSLKIDGKCLARFTDGLWCKSKIEGIEEDGRFVVSFECKKDVLVVGHEEIMPFDEESNAEQQLDSDSDSDFGETKSPAVAYIAPKTTVAMGEWEAHTKGIGSRIMAKMGYIVGQGLGKHGDGKAEPVPIEVLPLGKSLDTVMKLKEQASNENLFNPFSNDKRKKKQLEIKNKAAYNKTQPTDVFDFINNKLDKKTGGGKNVHGPRRKDKNSEKHAINSTTKEISLRELSKKSDRTLNVQLMKTEEELRRVKREMIKLQQSISRNEDRNQSVVKKLQHDLQSLEKYKNQLQISEKAIGQQKNQRNAHKKLTIF